MKSNSLLTFTLAGLHSSSLSSHHVNGVLGQSSDFSITKDLSTSLNPPIKEKSNSENKGKLKKKENKGKWGLVYVANWKDQIKASNNPWNVFGFWNEI